MQPTDTDGTLAERLLQIAHDLPRQRLTRITHDGQSYFVKTPEHHASLRWRMQKGDPEAAFARESALLRGFAARGARVARIVAADDRHMVLADHGPPLQQMVARGQADAGLMQRLGAALAELHAPGLAHGRPSLRDICWNGTHMTFLDLEAGAKLQATAPDQARDLFLLLHSVFVIDGSASPLAEPLLSAYRDAGDPAVWHALSIRSRRVWWLEALTRPLAWAHRIRGKKRSEFAALRATRRLVART